MKDKEIEEMARIIKAVKYEPFNDGKPTYTVGNQMEDFVFDLIAEELIKQGYRNCKKKVVLSRERYDYLTVCFDKFVEIMEDVKKLERKETAEKILNEVYWLVARRDAMNVLNNIIELAKQFGVEIKE